MPLADYLAQHGLTVRQASRLISYDLRTLRRIVAGQLPQPPRLISRLHAALYPDATCPTCGHRLGDPAPAHCGEDASHAPRVAL